MTLRRAGAAVAILSVLAVRPASAGDDARPRIVVLGDSLTSGRGIGESNAYPAILQQKLDIEGLDYAVVNAGVSGDTSARALRRLDAVLGADVRILIVELGANDGLRGLPVGQVKANVGRIIEAAQARHIAVLLCGMETLPIHGWGYTVAFHNAYRELADEYDVPLVPFVMMNVIGHPELMQPDRAHPNADGARAIADNVWPFLLALAKSH
jgi:acyl-CoA thioesterase I